MATALKGVNASASGLVVAAALILGQSYATSLPEQVASLTTAVQTMATLTTPMLTIAVLLLYWLWLHLLRLRRLTARAGHRHAVLLRHHFLRRAPGAHRLARLAPSRANVLGQRNLPFCIAFRMQRGVTRGAHLSLPPATKTALLPVPEPGWHGGAGRRGAAGGARVGARVGGREGCHGSHSCRGRRCVVHPSGVVKTWVKSCAQKRVVKTAR